MVVIKKIRKRLPQAGGNNLWKILQRFCRIVKASLIGRDYLARLLKKYCLQVFRRKRRQVKTTYSRHGYAVGPNLAKDLRPQKPNELLVADITYLSLEKGHVYLFLITDAFSRMIVGWHIAQSLSHEGAIAALQMALKIIPNPQGVIHHTDRGAQYCCHDFLDEIRKWKLQSSMTDADHCAQNALAEAMNGILKTEFLLDSVFKSFAQAKAAVAEAIDTYNHFRIHGQLNERTPAEVHFGKWDSCDLWLKEIAAFSPPPFLDQDAKCNSLCVNRI